jgi:hypothetical protein
MTPEIIIFGTDHNLQCGMTDKFSPAEIEKYKSLIMEACDTHKIKLIAEEMHQAGLTRRNIANTIAFNLCQEHNIEHMHVDLTDDERKPLKIDEHSILDFTLHSFPGIKIHAVINDKIIKNISFPIRERCWFARILSINIWPTLFICGENHVENMRVLIRKVNKKSFVCAYRYSGGNNLGQRQ